MLSTRWRYRVSALVALVLLGTRPPAPADGEVEPRSVAPEVPAVVAPSAPTIDGLLDDACWQTATHIEDFRREKVEAPALEPTEAWICYDERAIYAAFRCTDSKPQEISCLQRKRQGRISDDDRVMLGIDVANDGRTWYYFYVTPAGTQSEYIPGGTSEKIEWKGDWRAAARIDESGWTAEMEIPFSILRYPDGQDTFRIAFSRVLARGDNDWCTWPPAFARVWDTDNCARWTGLSTPPVPFRCTLMPYALTVYSDDDEDREPLSAGLDAKGTFPNGVVGLFTYNPDFRNIEDVVETIDFTFVERYLPEYRPFFQEGAQYLPSSRIFYSRRVEDFDAGLKTFGTLGRHRFSILDAYRRSGENHLAWRYQHMLGTNGAASLSGLTRRVSGEPDNDVYDLSAYWSDRFDGGNHHYSIASTHSRTQGEGGDDAYLSLFTSHTRFQGLSWNCSYESTLPEFRSDDGYVPETGVRDFHVGLDHRLDFDEGDIQQRRAYLFLYNGSSDEGRRRHFWTEYNWRFRNGRWWQVGLTQGERDRFDLVDAYCWFGWNEKDMYRSGAAGLNVGERYGEPYWYSGFGQAFRPSDRWSAQLDTGVLYAASLNDDGAVVPPDRSRQFVLTTAYDITDERTVSARVVRGDGNTNAYAAYRQRLRSGTDVLIVLGDPNADEWVSRLAVKAIWCY